jgi:hypothetical protein
MIHRQRTQRRDAEVNAAIASGLQRKLAAK